MHHLTNYAYQQQQQTCEDVQRVRSRSRELDDIEERERSRMNKSERLGVRESESCRDILSGSDDGVSEIRTAGENGRE